MIPKLHALGFALAAFGLFACNQEDKIVVPTHTGGGEGTGSARVALPAIPADFLLKAGAGTKALFALTVSGEGMAPIHKTWTLTSGAQTPVYVNDIPAGKVRVFHGQLVKLDSAMNDTSVTHEGSDSAWIDRDSVTEVHLYLRKAGGGSAHVCVDVEGWPSDSSCIRPPINNLPNVAGCWNLSITKRGATPKQDSIFKAKLRIDQWDTSLFATVTWNSGARDSSTGILFPPTMMYFGYYGPGNFRMKGMLDSTTSLYTGYFNDSLRGIYGDFTASRTACDTLIDTLPTDTLIRVCYGVSQILTHGKSGAGRLTLESNGTFVWGAFHWTGFPSMAVSPSLQKGRIDEDTTILDLHAFPPKGMMDSTVKNDTLSYRVTAMPYGTAGSIFQLAPKGALPAGSWKITRGGCTEKDNLP
jgi:hypothetical protein